MVRKAKKTQFVKEFHEIDKETFKICEAVKLGLDTFFLEENKPIKITEAHTDFARPCRVDGCSKSTPGTPARVKPTEIARMA